MSSTDEPTEFARIAARIAAEIAGENNIRFLGSPTSHDPFNEEGFATVRFPIYDGDSRRWVGLKIVDVDNATWQKFNSSILTMAPIHTALAAKLDAGEAITFAEVKPDGTVITTTTTAKKDVTPGTHYAPPKVYRLSGHSSIETATRNDLVEEARLAPFVDIVHHTASPSERLIFRHYEHSADISKIWKGIQIPARLQGYPNIAPIRHLVVSEPGMSGGVLGFTTPFIPGGSLEATGTTRPFKLKWAEQLFQLIDNLNLEHGFVHNGISPRNLVIDPITDNLILTKFSAAVNFRKAAQRKANSLKPPKEAEQDNPSPQPNLDEFAALYDDASPAPKQPTPAPSTSTPTSTFIPNTDVTAAIITLHYLVNHNLFSPPITPSSLSDLTTGPWKGNPQTLLDSPPSAYYSALTTWLKSRAADPRRDVFYLPSTTPDEKENIPPTKSPLGNLPEHMPIRRGEKIKLPEGRKYWHPLAEEPEEGIKEVWVSGRDFLKRDAVREGKKVLEWVRVVATQREGGKEVLVSGRYVGEVSGEGEGERGKRRRGGRGDSRVGRGRGGWRSGRGGRLSDRITERRDGRSGKGKDKDGGKGKGKSGGRVEKPGSNVGKRNKRGGRGDGGGPNGGVNISSAPSAGASSGAAGGAGGAKEGKAE